MNKFTFKKILLFLLIAAFIFPNFQGLALTPQGERESLEEELKKLEEQIAQYQEDINKTEQEKRTLQDQIYILRKQIEKLDLQIYQSNIVIKDLSYQVVDTGESITKTSDKIYETKDKLADILQLIYEEDQKSLLEVLLSEAELSDFFNNLIALETLNNKNQELLEEIKGLKVALENQKQSLDEEKTNLESAVKIKTLQKQESEYSQQQKDYFLRLTEAEYQEHLKKRETAEKKAAEIRARIFELIGVPEAPTFGEALDIAKYVENLTGVRPALLLAVLKQESDIGKNVGQCYLKNPSTGGGVVAYNSKEVSGVMKPSRDVPHFLTITAELGRDPYNTPVSCPMSYGWGGAMGPAQFIPSTWMIYRDKVAGITGKAADPWNIKDAFLAAALYLKDYGAANQTYNSEWKAAMIYFSGTSKRTSYNGYGFYGDSVMNITAQLQKDIDTIEESG